MIKSSNWYKSGAYEKLYFIEEWRQRKSFEVFRLYKTHTNFLLTPHLSPTPGPVRRSTVQRTAAADHSETKSTRDITLSRPETYQLTTRPTVATPVTL
ncbi:hypothetical protein NPIL_116421, partial [Nephila pilipes]